MVTRKGSLHLSVRCLLQIINHPDNIVLTTATMHLIQRGNVHLAWSIPMKESSYFIPSSFIHSFMMHAPFLVMGQKYMWVQGVFLFLTGPWLAEYITDNKQEAASIWCFFSICQIAIMVFLIRDKLIKPAAIAAARKQPIALASSDGPTTRSTRSRKRD